jgi:hypothetical protein
MTGESHSRPAQRMSRFSQAYRNMPGGSEQRGAFDRPVESVLSRADDTAVREPGRASAQWQRYSPPELAAEVIEVEFETVAPVPLQDDENGKRDIRDSVLSNGNGAAHVDPGMAFDDVKTEIDEVQPPPPDIEAIAAALAAEMDRNAALNARPAPVQPTEEDTATPPPAEPLKVRLEIVAPDEAEAAPPVIPDTGESTPAATASVAVPEAAPTAQAESYSAKAAAQFRQITAQISPLSKRAVHFVRTKSGPAAIKAGYWLAHNLRRKEIRRRYGKVLALAHGRVLDRGLEQHFFIPSLKAERFAPDPERAILYEGPVPATVFDWVMSALPQDMREYTFVDFRAGLGRAVLLASQRRFERIVGYEYSAAAYDDLQMNIAQFPRSKMLCRDVQCYRGDRTGVSIPDQPCVLYVANAWREEFLDGIMTYLGESYRHKPRRLYLILENVDDKLALPKTDIFYRLDIPRAEKLKLRLLSPMEFEVYRTLA